MTDPPGDAVEAREAVARHAGETCAARSACVDAFVLGRPLGRRSRETAGWTQTMVKVQAHRARKRLKKLLEESNEP